MKVQAGEVAKMALEKIKRYLPTEPNPYIYDYPVRNGMVIIERNTKECTYIKTSGSKQGFAIALQGMPEEFSKYRKIIEFNYEDALVIDWSEVEEMVEWTERVPK